MNNLFKVNIDDIKYDICIGRNIEETLLHGIERITSNKNVLLVTDKYFAEKIAVKLRKFLESKGFNCLVYEMKGGKGSKSFAELIAIYGILESQNFSRDSTLIALGGGVIGDLGGFAASTWYRGMNLIHIPTSLMAMVDSSIGGKVAINFRETINAVGNYYHPSLNLMDLEIIDTLPQRDYLSGMAEVIKCGLIADEEFFIWLENKASDIIARNDVDMRCCIENAIRIKINHVNGDVKESGKRLLLNFGHTLGHAIEMATQTEAGETYRHGEGVSLGIVAAMLIANKFIKLDYVHTERVIKILEIFNLPVSISASSLGFLRNDLIDLCFNLSFKDKKRKDNSLRFILLDKIGSAAVYSEVPEAIIMQVLSKIILE